MFLLSKYLVLIRKEKFADKIAKVPSEYMYFQFGGIIIIK